MNPNIPLAPAPWNLRGQGWLFLYHFSEKAQTIPELLPRESTGAYQGGLGALMLVDYQSSDVGPYQELLFIPGRFRFGQEKFYSISRIWVSTEASVVNGQNNWGIPKELASFSVARKAREEVWSVKRPDGKEFFRATLQKGRLPFPMHTSLLPFPLLQSWKGELFQTSFSGRGWARLAKLQELHFQSDIFPAISSQRPLFGMAIDPFSITFPVARMLKVPSLAQKPYQNLDLSQAK